MTASLNCKISSVLMSFLVFISPLPALAQEKVALPGNVTIVQPGESISPDMRQFSGKWYGVWDDTLEHILVVEEVNGQDDVQIIYGYGTAPSWNISTGEWFRIRAKFDANTLKGTLGNGAVVAYKFQRDGTLSATFERKGRISRAVLKKMD